MNTKQLSLIVLGCVVVGIVSGYVGGMVASTTSQSVGGRVHNQVETFDAGVQVNGTDIIDSSGNWIGGVSSTGAINIGTLQMDGASSTTELSCGTASYTVPALGARFGSGTAFATTTVTVPGATNGDYVESFGWNPQSATGTLAGNGIAMGAEITTGTTAVAHFFNMTNVTSTAIATGTIKVCYRTVI